MYTLTYNDRRAHYLATPRTGSKACRDAFLKAGATSHGSHHDVKPELIQPGDLVISTVRNHWDWFVSFWYLTGCKMQFSRFVPQLCSGSEWITRNQEARECQLYWKYAPLSTYILRYERLEQDLNTVLEQYEFPTFTLEWNGTPKPRPYQTYYKSQIREYIRLWFGKEINKYGYTF